MPIELPSTKNDTDATPLVASLALAVMVTLPATVAPDAGEVIDTVGATLSMVTDTPGLKPTFPAGSIARAWSWCTPALSVVVSSENEYGTVVSVPRRT